jgi:hypothetical protein
MMVFFVSNILYHILRVGRNSTNPITNTNSVLYIWKMLNLRLTNIRVHLSTAITIQNLRMTRITLPILIILQSFNTFSQKLEIQNRNRNMRAGFSNFIKFSLNAKFDSVDLKVTQGAAEREGDIIRLTPKMSGKDTLFAKFLRRGKSVYLDTLIFDIIKPEVFPSYGGDLIKDRKISLSRLKAQGGIIFFIRVTDDHWEGAGVTSYRFSVIRKDSCIFSKIETSSKYSDELKAKLDLLIRGDKILISDATINSLFAEIANILPGVFEIE